MPTQVLGGKTPYKLLFGKPLNIQHLCVFGCLCFYTNLFGHDKFASRATRCIFMENPMLKKGVSLYDPQLDQFFVSRDIVFHEDVFPFATLNTSPRHSTNLPTFLDNYLIDLPWYAIILEATFSLPSQSIPTSNDAPISCSSQNKKTKDPLPISLHHFTRTTRPPI